MSVRMPQCVFMSPAYRAVPEEANITCYTALVVSMNWHFIEPRLSPGEL